MDFNETNRGWYSEDEPWREFLCVVPPNYDRPSSAETMSWPPLVCPCGLNLLVTTACCIFFVLGESNVTLNEGSRVL